MEIGATHRRLPEEILCYTIAILIPLLQIYKSFLWISGAIGAEITQKPLGWKRSRVDGLAAEVRADQDVRHGPEWMLRRDRIDREDIETGAAEMAAT
jgi:hypothetical protein